MEIDIAEFEVNQLNYRFKPRIDFFKIQNNDMSFERNTNSQIKLILHSICIFAAEDYCLFSRFAFHPHLLLTWPSHIQNARDKHKPSAFSNT